MNDPIVYDVAIIGGGLAGLSLAIQCADNNFNVVLYEKEEYPFHKVCGEYISLESWNFLNSLGVNLDELDLPVIKTLQLSDIKGTAYFFDLPLGGFGVSRFYLDDTLYKIALAKGVKILTKSKVDEVKFYNDQFIISTGNKSFIAKTAAGCFGKRSNLDVKWKRSFTLQKANSLNNYIGIKYHIRYDHEKEVISLHNFYNGYCGLSKIENDKSCLCYLTTAQNLRDCENSIEKMQRQILYKNPQLKEIFTNAHFLYDQPLAISQISFNKRSQVEDHVLMIGDAAGMISPLCGNGMSMAMHASRLAFISLERFLSEEISRDAMEKGYCTSWSDQFRKRLQTGRIVQRFFGGETSTSVFIRSMRAFPLLAKWVIRSTHGEAF